MHMANDPIKAESALAQSSTGPDRRTFIAVAGASMMAGAGALISSPANAQSQAGQGIAGATEVKRPEGLGPRAMMDNRFPATYSESVPKACQVIVGYFTALSQRDLKGMAEYLHYPFATFEGVEAVVVNSQEEL